ncbi:hypothetical protein JOF53_000765 [Crossiella equi]|uniref:Uncharacterized protein n=1 Tax=Crossiella equi TaxID=130796 RepID=A0ABS5A5M0_9PSEU|nr:DUF5988 family protein [Crossiella equi]MBP2471893.1 hypothetical protein [Crossiella equi]
MSEQTPNAVLVGDRNWIPDTQRLRHVPDGETLVKVFSGHRYENYRASEQETTIGEHRVRVFRWASSSER